MLTNARPRPETARGSQRAALMLVGSLFMVGCAATSATSPTAGSAPSTSTVAPQATLDVFGYPVTSPSTPPRDCPLAFAGWTPAAGNKIDVIVRLPGPVTVDITAKSAGRVDEVRSGLISDRESLGRFEFDVADDEVEQILLHITSESAADVSCYVTNGD